MFLTRTARRTPAPWTTVALSAGLAVVLTLVPRPATVHAADAADETDDEKTPRLRQEVQRAVRWLAAAQNSDGGWGDGGGGPATSSRRQDRTGSGPRCRGPRCEGPTGGGPT